MDAGGCTDPAEVLPDAMARLEQIGTEDGWRSQLKLFGKDSLDSPDR